MSEQRACTAPRCDRAARTPGATYCNAHYFRLRRTGKLDLVVRIPKTCDVPDCSTRAKTRGLCGKHAERLRKYGDIDAVRRGPGPIHPQWQGEDVDYHAVHARLRTHRGPARNHTCTDCGTQAAHWSYDHSGRAEQTGPNGPYSTALDSYQARCVSCHKLHDLARHRSERALR